jgi:hypothetical protein
VLAIDRQGTVRTIAGGLGNGINPIVVVRPPPKPRPAGPPPGLYLADTITRQIWFAPAEDVQAFVGAVVVATELTGQLWAIRPNGSGFDALPAPSDLPQHAWNLEGSAYVS